jgi:hypothetical protein
MVLGHQVDYRSQWAAIQSIAMKIGCTAETLRKWVRWASAILLLVACVVSEKSWAQRVAVDLELVLAVDGSRSIDPHEFALQVNGTAAAFQDRRFLAALRSAAPQGIAVTLVQWAGYDDQVHVVGWHHVRDAASASVFAARVLAAGRALAPGPTSIGGAIDYSARLMETNGFSATRQVIDVSADGYNNSGNRPEIARDDALANGITINGLTVMNEVPGLDRYFSSRVIGGPGAFVVEALDFEQYADAFLRKLVREVTGSQVTVSTPEIRLSLD